MLGVKGTSNPIMMCLRDGRFGPLLGIALDTLFKIRAELLQEPISVRLAHYLDIAARQYGSKGEQVCALIF